MKQIAITPRYLSTKEGDFIVVKKKYYPFFEKYGFNLNLIPYIKDKKMIEKVITSSDIVLLAGGYEYYTKEIRKFEMNILKIALEKKKPVVGICCGMWTINSFYGGNLKFIGKHEGRISNPIHKANITDLLKKRVIQINSFHEKAIDRLGKGIKPFIIAKDGNIEAIYRDNNILGIQFHLENKGCSKGLADEIIGLLKENK